MGSYFFLDLEFQESLFNVIKFYDNEYMVIVDSKLYKTSVCVSFECIIWGLIHQLVSKLGKRGTRFERWKKELKSRKQKAVASANRSKS